jgi:hypothetical protein
MMVAHTLRTADFWMASNMARHTKHGPDDLKDALEHVVYEIWKYKQSVTDYARIQAAGGDAAIEFRVLHHRVLLEFFYGSPKHEDNIFAWEYIDDWRKTHDSKKVPWLRGYMARCHTMLAHISTKRSEMAKRGLKDWGKDWQTVEPQLDKIILAFISGLSVGHKEIFRGWIKRWASTNPGSRALSDLAAIIG